MRGDASTREEMILREATMQWMLLREGMTLREGRMLCEGMMLRAEHAMSGDDGAPGDGTRREYDAAH